MGFSRATVEIRCDTCGMDTDPEELSYSPAGGGSYSLEDVRTSLRDDGWLVDNKDRITCVDCVQGDA